ncbi:MAG: STAS/SEC14 domain-containing protein [Adhaeribacter sp.]
MEEVYFKDDCLALYYNRQHRTARAVWNGFLSGETLRQAIEQCTRLLEEEKPLYWLADNRKMKAIRQKDQEWIQAHLVPKIVASSLRKMATLVSEDIFNRMAIENLFVKANDLIKFDHQYFKNEKAATQWLKEKHSIPS